MQYASSAINPLTQSTETAGFHKWNWSLFSGIPDCVGAGGTTKPVDTGLGVGKDVALLVPNTPTQYASSAQKPLELLIFTKKTLQWKQPARLKIRRMLSSVILVLLTGLGCCGKNNVCGPGPDYCAKDKCINNCDAKAECNPGDWDNKYINATTCPLNVCCSKFGFCGTTEEFCGNKTVSRPLCDASSQQITRVIGYYNSAAANRPCADSKKQNTFFLSLTNFMTTWGFTDIDIDWEYPAADDHFPKFMANLKKALTDYQFGLSVTLFTSYWYLQHFDLESLDKSVDWFNFMSYDLHGTWDMGNKWIGAYLDAYTNLTEIKTALDLLWRNDIKPLR
ncbi:hypothetical protein AARAC_000133 [Aspergillus arachidicola]|uniref:Uncharacterized protein n=1 Tax=Aspergillus arachidicola TaxID=656916 RepID=A0A2G7FNE1_9EURO|nr:hypothetical protein AARAC_000133 [Aspergillus arachidicola]